MNGPHSHRAVEDGTPPELRPPWHTRIRRAIRTRNAQYGDHGLGWRLMTPAVFILAGVLMVTSAISSHGTDLRPGRYDDLADLAASRSDKVAELSREGAQLQAQIDSLTDGLTGDELDEAGAAVDALRDPAGLVPVEGPGVTITLKDAPKRLDDDPKDTPLRLVHQQDIQAVANALLAGGAEAVTVQGKRIVSTVGIKCVGNSVLLQGKAYGPPFVISAIGNSATMLRRVDEDSSILQYLAAVELYGKGWDVEIEDKLEMPAYTGSTETLYARPLA